MEYKVKINFTPSIITTIIFVILKVNEIIKWSWIWVFSPLWIFSLLALIFIGIVWIKYKR